MARDYYRGPEPGVTGGEAERDTFGRVQLGKGFAALLRDRGNERGYMPYEEALRLVKEATEQDPENPSAEFANDLRLELIDMIAEEMEGEGTLKIWATNGTPIDRFHGVDAFIEYTEEGMRGAARVTLDVTLNQAKGTEYKADIVFNAPPEPDSPEYLAYVAEIAKQVMEVLRPQIDDRRGSSPSGRVFRRQDAA